MKVSTLLSAVLLAVAVVLPTAHWVNVADFVGAKKAKAPHVPPGLCEVVEYYWPLEYLADPTKFLLQGTLADPLDKCWVNFDLWSSKAAFDALEDPIGKVFEEFTVLPYSGDEYDFVASVVYDFYDKGSVSFTYHFSSATVITGGNGDFNQAVYYVNEGANADNEFAVRFCKK